MNSGGVAELAGRVRWGARGFDPYVGLRFVHCSHPCWPMVHRKAPVDCSPASIRAVRLAIDQVKGAGTGPYERGYSCARYLPTSVFEAFKHPLVSPLISLIARFFVSFPAIFLCGFPPGLTTGFLRNFTRNVIREIVVDRV